MRKAGAQPTRMLCTKASIARTLPRIDPALPGDQQGDRPRSMRCQGSSVRRPPQGRSREAGPSGKTELSRFLCRARFGKRFDLLDDEIEGLGFLHQRHVEVAALQRR